MPRLAIIGLGLIGGSVGLAVKRAKLAELEVVGYDIERGVGGRARKLAAIDTEARSLRAAAEGAAIVMIATPILQARAVLEEIAPVLGEGAVVTDTASTKREILRWSEELLPGHASFIGGHPIAGKEQQGLAAADAALFEGRPWAITPTARSPESAVRTVENLVTLVGGNVVSIDAEEHDSYVAAVSHLPLMLSVALFSLVSESQAWPDLARLAGPGFRDLTRLASGSSDMSLDICLTNRDNVVQWIDRLRGEMARFRQLLQEDDDLEGLGEVFFKAQANRDAFLSKPPAYPEPEGPRDSLTAGERMLSFMVGEYAIRRKKEMEELLEQRAESDKDFRPRRRGG